MKNYKILLSVTLLIALGFSQLKAQTMKEGQISINTYYGVNAFTAVLKRAYQISDGTQYDFKIKGAGPVGLNFEYMLTDNIGLGADMYYANSVISWKDTKTTTNSFTGISETRTYDYKVAIPRIGVLARANFHFINDEKFDGYAIVAGGYKSVSYKFTTNDPDYVKAKAKGLFPLALKLGVGFRYFFTDNLGLNTEIALGTPLVAGGLSLKF